MNLSKLQKAIGYTFIDENYLKQALTHSSCSEVKFGHPFNNERMEFVGDRVLNFCIADKLYHTFLEENEGMLAKRHASLVQEATLADVAEAIGLGEYLSLGKGEERSGGREKPSILSDAMEALIAAIYLDSNIENARNFVEKFWPDEVDIDLLRDPKSRLQEWLQARHEPLPTYTIVKSSGRAHERLFEAEVITQKYGSATGAGETKRQAQQNAAKALLEQLIK